MRLVRGHRVTLAYDPDQEVGTVMRCRGQFAEVRWPGRSRNYTHRKDVLVRHYRRGKLGKHQELEAVDAD